VGAVLHGVPTIGIVALPKEDLLYATPNIGGSVSVGNGVAYDHALLGLTLGAAVAKNPFYWEFNRCLIEEFGSMVSEPSVQSGIDFISGRTRLFVACNSNHWDLCAIAALALEQGAVVRHCDGTQIDWSPRRTKFAPVVFSRTKDDALRVTRLYFDAYEYIHPHDK
jgi:fructose-1,6-bisphosphatase/inositol monophosphatase family enzyme